MDIVSLTQNLQRFATDNAPAILTAFGVSGLVGTAILSTKATFQAVEDHIFRDDDDATMPSPREILRGSWKRYIPAAIVGTVSIAAIIGAHTISTRRNAAIMSAFSVLETASREYREKVVEQLGHSKEERIRDQMAIEKMERNPLGNSQVIITGTGEHLCYDSLSGRYFKSDVEKIRRAQNDINAECLSNMYASQNDFYRKIGLPANVFGEELGWSFDNLMDIQFTSKLSEDNQPCLALVYHIAPIHGYHKVNR